MVKSIREFIHEDFLTAIGTGSKALKSFKRFYLNLYTKIEKTMQFTLKRIIDTHPEWIDGLKKKCYAINGCLQTVHQDLGPFLNEYMYQDALQILLDEQQIPYIKEYYFAISYHGKQIAHKHFVDFLINDEIIVECKAVEKLCIEHRQQLWNYMRLTGKQIGVLYNFGPIKGQSEHYYLHIDGTMYMF